MEKELEEQRKQKFKNRMCEFEERNKQILSKAQSIQEDLAIKGKLSNIVHTGLNKVEEDIVMQFENAGLSFYSDSIVAEAIAEQIIAKVNRGHQILANYDLVIRKSEEEKNQIARLGRPSILSRIFEKIKKRFIFSKKTISPEVLEKARAQMDDYRNINKELGEYDLREAIIPAIMQLICPEDNIMYLYQSVPPLMESDIEPTLIKLGFSDLIPRLQQEITTRYEKEEQRGLYSSHRREMPELEENENQQRF